MSAEDPIDEEVRAYYRQAAADRRDGYVGDPRWGGSRYDAGTLTDAPAAAGTLSMGCGNLPRPCAPPGPERDGG